MQQETKRIIDDETLLNELGLNEFKKNNIDKFKG